MKAQHIYINKAGVPCAVTKEMPNKTLYGYDWAEEGRYAYDMTIESIKQSAIPIREEDFLDMTFVHDAKPDTFYPVEPYIFAIENGYARIVKTPDGWRPGGAEVCFDNSSKSSFREKPHPEKKELRSKIIDILKDGVTYSHQTQCVVIHGAVEELVKLFEKEFEAREEAYHEKHPYS